MLWHGKNFRGIINKAKQMIFDNTGTDLISTNAEDAIKEVNSNLTGKISGIGTPTTVSLPYTATADGFLQINLTPDVGQLANFYLTIGTRNFRTYAKDASISNTAVIKSGEVIADSYHTNVSSVEFYFIPFVH